jgi:hypothetical protein
MTEAVSKVEQRRQQLLDRRNAVAAEVLDAPGVALTRPALSFTASVWQQAMPRELLDEGLIAFDDKGQVRIANYDPKLLAPNPQRGRLEDRNLEELAASLDNHGQQEPILARLVTPLDRQRWPDKFSSEQILLILKGHRLFQAQPKTKLEKLRVELMLPFEGETDIDYSRRALRRASIRMMHSQGYTIFDKVNLYMIWRSEFALAEPKDNEVAAYFEISRTEAQRVKAVANLDDVVEQKIRTSDKPIAEEVVVAIANRPRAEQQAAFERFGHLTVAALRRLQQADKPPEAPSAAGRPRQFGVNVGIEGFPITRIETSWTAQQWKENGGDKAFWTFLNKLARQGDVQRRVRDQLE